MRKLLCLLFLFGVSLLCSCGSKIEINSRDFITGVYIDKSIRPNEVEVMIGTPLPNRLASAPTGGGTPSGNPYSALSRSARTIPDALQEIQHDLTRKITWGHTRIIVVGKLYAEQGLNELFEWLIREPAFNLKTYLFIAPQKAADIAGLTPVYKSSPSEVLLDIARMRTTLTTSIKDYLEANSAYQDVAIPMLTFGKMPLVSEKGAVKAWAGTGGIAVFSNGKLVGTIQLPYSRSIAWVKGTLKNPNYSVKLEQSDDMVSFSLEKMKSNIRPRILKDRIYFDFTLTANANILQASNADQNLLNPSYFHKLERMLNEQVASNLRIALQQTRRMKADVLQLGYLLEWRYPQQWEKLKYHWRETYRDKVDFNIQVDTKIMNFGIETTPFWSG